MKLTRRDIDLIDVFHNRLEPAGVDWMLSAAQAPSEAQRANLAAAHTALLAHLAPASAKYIKTHVHLMFAEMSANAAHATQDEAKAVADMYASSLKDLPAWALDRAFKAARHGKLNDGGHPATPAQLRIYAGQEMTHDVADLTKVDRVLKAKIRPTRASDPDAHAANLARCRALREELAGAAERDPLSHLPGSAIPNMDFKLFGGGAGKAGAPPSDYVLSESLQACIARWTKPPEPQPPAAEPA